MPSLHLEDVDGENGGLAVSETGLCRPAAMLLDDHAAFGRGVRAVVDGAEGHLRAGAGVHGVQVVDQRLPWPDRWPCRSLAMAFVAMTWDGFLFGRASSMSCSASRRPVRCLIERWNGRTGAYFSGREVVFAQHGSSPFLAPKIFREHRAMLRARSTFLVRSCAPRPGP